MALKMGRLYWHLAREDAGDFKKLMKAMMKHCTVSQPVVQVIGEVSPGEFLIEDQLSPGGNLISKPS